MFVAAVSAGNITDHFVAAGKMAPMLASGVATSIGLATWNYTGGLRGVRPEIDGMDELERRETERKTYRRPIEYTLGHIGEGRGKCLLFRVQGGSGQTGNLLPEANLH